MFSIIIPTRDRPEFLKKAIRSVLNQKFDFYELIIVDDHSSYNIKNLINEFGDSRIKLLKQSRKERSAARNLGIKHSNGSYICFLDDDDEYTKDFLIDFYKEISINPDIKQILRTGFIKVEYKTRKKSTNYNPSIHANPINFAANNMCGVWSLCIPKEFLVEDIFPEEFPHWQDTHLILRLLAKYPFKQLSSHNYIYKIHIEMGSRKAMQENVIDERLQLNLDAINDLFDNYWGLLKPFLPKNIRSKILAGKYLHFASGAIFFNQAVKALQLLWRSLSHGVYFNYYKYYIMIPYRIIISRFPWID